MFVSTYRYPYIISRHFIVFNLVAKHFLLFAFLWSKLCNATLDNKLLSWQVDLYCNYVSQLVQILMNTSPFNRVQLQSEGCKLKTRFFFNVLITNSIMCYFQIAFEHQITVWGATVQTTETTYTLVRIHYLI